ncbi:MAG TPA: tannase/feruloyl esterase family alpha/beta hydrolase [Bryobacteraceae bacterium]|nr:tannase/feruloyl esterase family alpha/beta hydrolase [Bryobacteraceae bacterium]
MSKFPRFGLCFVVVSVVPGPAAWATGSASCNELAKFSLPNTTITSAQVVDAGGFKAPGNQKSGVGNPYANLPSFCRVAATLAPSSDSDIKIEVWLPVENWNKKLQSVGNGGWAGVISYPALAKALREGYAAASTDTGHVGGSGSFALGHQEKLIDFGWRSEHEMTVKAKAIARAFYGNAPRLSYWNGSSTGGRQGLKDGLITDPTECNFDPKVLLCKNDDGPSCLTAPQVEAAKKIYSPGKNPRTGQELFPSLVPGSELGWGVQAHRTGAVTEHLRSIPGRRVQGPELGLADV